MSKERTQIPENVAADVLFRHHHICCVCNERGKAVQIHHIDVDPANHKLQNLAVLCFDDHHRTQVTGGFGRKLTAIEVVRCRDDWVKRVETIRREADKIAVERMSEGPLTTATRVAANSSGEIEWRRPPDEMLDAYIRHLPDLRHVAYVAARTEWDSGVNSRMKIATHKLNDIFERVLVHLANWYAPNHFGGKAADHYFSELVASRALWHLDALSPHGHSGHGTGLGLDAAGNLLADLESAILEMVFALRGLEIIEHDPTWRARWEAAAN